MSRYIDAEEVEKRIDVVIGSEPKAWDKKALKELKMYIVHAVPSADVRENVRGEWLPHQNKSFREWDVCSACGTGCKRREYGIHANGKKWVTEYNFPFCPNCGADMRGDKS